MKPKNKTLPSWVAVFALMFPLLACIVSTPGSPSPTPTEAATDTLAPPAPTDTASGPCQAVTSTDVTIYDRPDLSADVFSTVPAGFTTVIDAQTASGWLGFDPGIAQAANIGSFRLRWFEPNSVDLTGDCGSLPVVWAPPPGICFDMPMEDVNVYAAPDPTSSVLAVLHVEDFAAVLGENGSGWVKVDLAPGNTGSSVQGWIDQTTLNMNGPCGSLPTISE